MFWDIDNLTYYFNKTKEYSEVNKKEMDTLCANEHMVRFSEYDTNTKVKEIAQKFGMKMKELKATNDKSNVICVQQHFTANGEAYAPKPLDDCTADGWGEHEGSCYKLFTDKVKQYEAVEKCSAQGGTLYMPKDKAEEMGVTEFVQSHYGHPDDYFIGVMLDHWGNPCYLNCQKTECIGKQLGYENWRTEGENWTIFYVPDGICIDKDKKWTNLDDKHAYLCKKPKKT